MLFNLGGSAPSTPYTKNKDGHGPAWSNSLFEDNAEYGLGVHVGADHIRQRLMTLAKELILLGVSEECKAVIQNWLDTSDDGEKSKPATQKMIEMFEGCTPENKRQQEIVKEILDNKEFLAKKSVWILGGDGWLMILVSADLIMLLLPGKM
jgi:pyruvate-ferredoxin/flavodoxin oxidoreductase